MNEIEFKVRLAEERAEKNFWKRFSIVVLIVAFVNVIISLIV